MHGWDFFCKNMGPQQLSESHRLSLSPILLAIQMSAHRGGGGVWRIWRGNTTSQHRRENLIQTRRRSPMHNPNDGGKRWALLLLPLCRLFPLPPPLPSISAVAVLIAAVASPPPLSHFPATAHFQYEVLIIPLILVFSVADFLYSDFWNQFTRCLQLISMSLRNAICGWSFRVPNSHRLWS